MWSRFKSALARVIRGMLSWASLMAIPLGIGAGLAGHMTIGALLVLGGTLAYFLVDPIMMMLDLIPSGDARRGRKRA
jgi:hypothetical protein